MPEDRHKAAGKHDALYSGGSQRRTSRLASMVTLTSPISSLTTRAFSRRRKTRTSLSPAESTVALIDDLRPHDASTFPLTVSPPRDNSPIFQNTDKIASFSGKIPKLSRSYTTNDLLAAVKKPKHTYEAHPPVNTQAQSPTKSKPGGSNTSVSGSAARSRAKGKHHPLPDGVSSTKLPLLRSTPSALLKPEGNDRRSAKRAIIASGASAREPTDKPCLPRSKTQPNLSTALVERSSAGMPMTPRRVLRKDKGSTTFPSIRTRAEPSAAVQQYSEVSAHNITEPDGTKNHYLDTIIESPNRRKTAFRLQRDEEAHRVTHDRSDVLLQRSQEQLGRKSSSRSRHDNRGLTPAEGNPRDLLPARQSQGPIKTHRRQSSFAFPTQSSAAKMHIPVPVIKSGSLRPGVEPNRALPRYASSFDVTHSPRMHPTRPTSLQRSSNSFSSLEFLTSRFKSGTENQKSHQHHRKSDIPTRLVSLSERDHVELESSKGQQEEDASAFNDEQVQEVRSVMVQSWWSGRLSTILDRLRNEEFEAQLRLTDARMRRTVQVEPSSPPDPAIFDGKDLSKNPYTGVTLSTDEIRVRRAFEVLKKCCVTPDASRSLREFMQRYAGYCKMPFLHWYLPALALSDHSRATTASVMTTPTGRNGTGVRVSSANSESEIGGSGNSTATLGSTDSKRRKPSFMERLINKGRRLSGSSGG